jgi:hypothetical protein
LGQDAQHLRLLSERGTAVRCVAYCDAANYGDCGRPSVVVIIGAPLLLETLLHQTVSIAGGADF